MSFLSNWSDLHVHEYAQLEISSKCYIKAANSSTLCKFHERRKGLQPIWPLLVCTWRHGNHVGGQGKKKEKHFSPFGTKPYFHRKSFEKKFYRNDHQHGRFFHVAEAKNQGGRTVRTCIFNKSAAFSIHPMSGFNHCWQLPVVNETTSSKISKKLSLFGNSWA